MMVRHGFRTREGGDLPVDTCGECKGETYQVPAGTWLHWATLGEGCPIAASEGQESALAGFGEVSTGEAAS